MMKRLLKAYRKWTYSPTMWYCMKLRGCIEAENFMREWTAEIKRALDKVSA